MRFASFVALCALVCASARAADPPPIPVYSRLLVFEHAVGDELKLSTEQARRPFVHSNPEIAQAMVTAPGFERIAAEYLTKQLTADQQKRIRQITLQYLAKNRYAGPTLAADQKLVDELALTGAQRDNLRTGEPIENVLSADQKKLWGELIGAPFPARVYPHHFAPDRPFELKVLLSHGAEIELKLTAEQVAKLEALSGRWYEAFPALGAKEHKALEPELVKGARAVLTDAQRVRAAQLLERSAIAPSGIPPENRFKTLEAAASRYLHPGELSSLTNRLKVTPEQLDRMRKAIAALPSLTELYTKGEDVLAARDKRAVEVKAATDAVLTAEQRAAYDALFGPPPVVPIDVTAGTEFPRRPLEVPPRSYLATRAFAHYSLELSAWAIEDSRALRKKGMIDAGVSEEQAMRLHALAAKRNPAPPEPVPVPKGGFGAGKKNPWARPVEPSASTDAELKARAPTAETTRSRFCRPTSGRGCAGASFVRSPKTAARHLRRYSRSQSFKTK
jgi:hypothetical protein